MVVTINEKIRFYKENDPYYYEVDNLPLIDLLENDKSLRDEINDIILNNQNWATEYFTGVTIQNAIGNSGDIDIQSDGVITPNNVVAWVLGKNYATLDDVDPDDEEEEVSIPKRLDDFLDIQDAPWYSASMNSDPGLILSWFHGNDPGREGGQHHWRPRLFGETGNTGTPIWQGSVIPTIHYLENRYFFLGQEKPAGLWPSDRILMTNRTPVETPETELDGPLFDDAFANETQYDARPRKFVRRFSDMGIVDHTGRPLAGWEVKKIYGRFGINQKPKQGAVNSWSQRGNGIFMLEHCHAPTTPHYHGDVSWNPKFESSPHTLHADELMTITVGDVQSATTQEHVIDFVVHYDIPIVGGTYEYEYCRELADGTIQCYTNTVDDYVLAFKTATDGHFEILDMFLYIYAYET